MTPLTREARIYLALWRKLTSDGVEKKIFFPDLGSCISFTRNMYRALKPYRDMKLHDPTLVEAIEKWALWHPKSFEDGKPYVMARPRMGLAMAEDLFERFGLDEDDIMSPAEKAAVASVEKVHQDLAEFLEADREDKPVEREEPEPLPFHNPTPFYSRG